MLSWLDQVFHLTLRLLVYKFVYSFREINFNHVQLRSCNYKIFLLLAFLKHKSNV